ELELNKLTNWRATARSLALGPNTNHSHRIAARRAKASTAKACGRWRKKPGTNAISHLDPTSFLRAQFERLAHSFPPASCGPNRAQQNCSLCRPKNHTENNGVVMVQWDKLQEQE